MAPEVSGAAPLATALSRLRERSASNDETTRRAAALELQILWEKEFDTVFDLTQEWALDPDERLRQVACLACLQRKESIDELRMRRLLSRVEVFIGDSSPRVRETWTTEVLPHLLPILPPIVLPWIKEWTKATEEAARADIATALGAICDRYPTEAVEGLAELSIDPRPSVRRAVRRSLEIVHVRYPAMDGYLQSRFGAILRTRG